MSNLNLVVKNDRGVAPRQGAAVTAEVVPTAYHEVPGLRHDTKDVLKQLSANLKALEDMTGRLGFMMDELKGLIRR